MVWIYWMRLYYYMLCWKCFDFKNIILWPLYQGPLFFLLIHMLCVFHSVDSLNVHWVKYLGKAAWISITTESSKSQREGKDWAFGIWKEITYLYMCSLHCLASVTIYFIYLTNKNHHYDNNYIKWCIGSVWWRRRGVVRPILGIPGLIISQIFIQKLHGLTKSHLSFFIFLLPETYRLCL